MNASSHIKNYGMDKHFWRYKGRIVFGGDLVKDETGHKAIFIEQSTSASYMSGTKLLDIVTCSPDCHGEDADKIPDFTQITSKEAEEVLGIEHVPETLISFPPDRWPDNGMNL